ncbi:hypothetical protein LPB140_01800 [Sphingorhabdus lutea]|uniref:Uncharacterized protein n=2 Tax=Sphingorhabdus lutea TaxID=1913578 RepID=A0A1L3JE92_9SPHN|nr:hypothetical protein LPB140_01800 [Sphingorhabdus lutea]
MQDIENAIARSQQYSPFLRDIWGKFPEIDCQIADGKFDEAMASAYAIKGADIAETLRKQRSAIALITAIADLSGHWDVSKVTRALSDFADHAVDMAVGHAIAQHIGADYDAMENPCAGFAVIALGKHGGRELNYSSDIDPILLYDPETLPHREGEDVAKAAVRIGRRVVDILSARDGHGYVFRVDLRLRPTPEVTPIVLTVNAAISYYESSAVAWEQAAFIRARAAAGDVALGQYFLDAIKPFIWRRSIDFGQIQNIHSMIRQIRNHYKKGQEIGLGFDVKKGRGGIREVEFFAQAHQLIYGGRNGELRIADTSEALRRLSHFGHVDADISNDLIEGYAYLRQVEHRLQMVDDRQTHELPQHEAQLEQLVQLDGGADMHSWMEKLQQIVQNISSHYDILIEATAEENMADGAGQGKGNISIKEQLTAFDMDETACERRIARWQSDKIRCLRSASARKSFEQILPSLLHALAAAPDPKNALNRFDDIIDKLPSAVNFFHLLMARPDTMARLADILSYAPILADELTRNISLFDTLIDPNVAALPQSLAEMRQYFETQIIGDEYELILDQVRTHVSELRFAAGVQLLSGQQKSEHLAQIYSHIAEVATEILVDATRHIFEQSHGKIEGSDLIILALGRLGGQALTHASDLDLIFLFTGEHDAQSNGRRPLGATHYYNRLTQRIIGALTVQTSSGPLYEVDCRLRPSGNKGLLCATTESFDQYQHKEAWTFEHMAMMRARTIYGGDAARGQIGDILDGIHHIKRDEALIHADCIKMRRDMDEHKPASGPLDIKKMTGGLIDIEFMIHYLQLTRQCALSPNLSHALQILIKQGHLPENLYDAFTLQSGLLIYLRLFVPDLAEPSPPIQKFIASALGMENWDALIDQLQKSRQLVTQIWTEIFGQER